MLVDRQGRPVELGPEVGRGGEGTVYEVSGRPQLVAKLYHQSVSLAASHKLASMVAIQTAPLLRIAAWPVDTLTEPAQPTARGLLMPRITGCKPIHQLYGPQSRLVDFPKADWRFILRAGANLARAFAVVHEQGQVVGDVNHANILVGQDATVHFIDCDSFQITTQGQRYLCDVGVSTHQPPEFQGLSTYRGVVRTPNHDNFGLAVLLFQLLMLGRHPFAGTFLGSGDLPLEQAIREYRFAYGSRAAAVQMRQPPHTPPLGALSRPVAGLFEQAFGPEGSRDGRRPRAVDWISVVDRLERDLRTCSVRLGHVFPRSLAACPWCEIESKVGLRFFPLVVSSLPANALTFDLARVWAEIEAVASPGPAPVLPGFHTLAAIVPSSEARRIGRARKVLRGIAGTVAMAGVVLAIGGQSIAGLSSLWDLGTGLVAACWIWAKASPPERAAFARQKEAARERWRQLEKRWRAEAGDTLFARKRAEIENAHLTYLDLPARRQRERQRLETHRQEGQLSRYLRGHPISGATIKGIGPGREVTLASYGVETANDVTTSTILGVPGFGPQLTEQIVSWRRGLERRFVYDPTKGIDPTDLEILDRELDRERDRVEAVLRGGAVELRRLREEAIKRRQILEPLIDEGRRVLAQAEADDQAT